ncbi:DNA polymerase III subunit delta [Pseudorhizobium endolithicum]|uniref:DNA-directed DNA polymerase n=1 Tax=Pseudorhizobium endolithicum TaxID=1191678 RepID=A0ABN7JUM7_9HYPH|nr:DNA polymerase III subunit delta [Pseudorhizobium endolithicum]CAD7049129.1 DNA polymerase III subunit delta [Pseudorhizobium endolithicum]
MAEVKSHEFDRFAERATDLYRIFVVYGPDRGLASERAAVLARKSGVAPDDPFATLKLDVSDLQNDPGRLLDEVNALGLFGGEKLVWIRNASNEKTLVDAMAVLASGPPPANFLLVEAGDLKKGSGLRKIAEASKTIAIIPCYADDVRALNSLIDIVLGEDSLTISPEARRHLVERLGGDRAASRNEIRKLALYCRGRERVEEEDVLAIIGDASGVSADEAVDAALTGDLPALRHALQKVQTSKTPVFLILQSCLKTFQMMELMRAEMDEKNIQPGQVMMTLGRHIHFKRKPLVEKALRIWPADALTREMERLQTAILQSRQKQVLEDSIAFQTLMAITLQSARARR